MSFFLDLAGLLNAKKRNNMIHWHFKNKFSSVEGLTYIQKEAAAEAVQCRENEPCSSSDHSSGVLAAEQGKPFHLSELRISQWDPGILTAVIKWDRALSSELTLPIYNNTRQLYPAEIFVYSVGGHLIWEWRLSGDTSPSGYHSSVGPGHEAFTTAGFSVTFREQESLRPTGATNTTVECLQSHRAVEMPVKRSAKFPEQANGRHPPGVALMALW